MDDSGSKACVYLGEELARYGFGGQHPFGNDRMYAFQQEFERRGLDRRARVLPPVSGSRAQLALFHDSSYLDFLETRSREGSGFLDGGDTPAFRGVWEASLMVAGSVCDAADRLLAGECRHAFVPIAGLHHARRDGAAGFCAINDCGIVRCPPWRAKRRRVVPGSREATRDTRRAEGAKGDPKGASERGVQSYGRPVCSRNELAMLWRNAG